MTAAPDRPQRKTPGMSRAQTTPGALRPLGKVPSLHHSVRAALRRYIIDNQLQAGDPLPPEGALAQQLGIGRNSVREGVKALGVLEVRRGVGAFVRAFTLDPLLENLPYTFGQSLREVEEILQIRQALEVSLIADVVAAISDAGVDALRGITDAMQAKALRGQDFADEDMAFHQALFDPLQNTMLLALIATFWRVFYRVSGATRLETSDPVQTYRDHLAIVDAVAARDKATNACKVMQAGIDPGALRKSEKARAAFDAVNTLEAVARAWLEHQSGRWAPITLHRITASLETYIFKPLGDRPVASVKPGEIMAAVKRIEKAGASDQAGCVLQRVKAIYRWAVTHERVDATPMVDLVPSEILKPREVTHRPAMSDAELPDFLVKLEHYQGDAHTVRSLRLLMLTAARPGDVRGALWSEFDLDAALWIIPAERMKMKMEHRVPLARQAVKLVRGMQALSGDRALVFPSPFYPVKSLSENTFNSALARMGCKGSATTHGFGALFSTVANECGWNPEVIERQLAHIEGNRVRAAHHRSLYLEDRVKLMQWWGDYLDGRKAGNVVKMPKRKA
jgi:DNA-binding FadR family transcriptional regulator/integrase